LPLKITFLGKVAGIVHVTNVCFLFFFVSIHLSVMAVEWSTCGRRIQLKLCKSVLNMAKTVREYYMTWGVVCEKLGTLFEW